MKKAKKGVFFTAKIKWKTRDRWPVMRGVIAPCRTCG